MNPDTNRFEQLTEEQSEALSDLKRQLTECQRVSGGLVRPDGSPVPSHWSTFRYHENVVIKGYTFRVAYIGETAILFEPVGPLLVGEADDA